MNKQKKKGFTSDTLKETAVMTIAVGIIAVAVYFFLIPSQTSISSISALAIIIAHYVPLHVSTVTMILNVVLLLIGKYWSCHFIQHECVIRWTGYRSEDHEQVSSHRTGKSYVNFRNVCGTFVCSDL